MEVGNQSEITIAMDPNNANNLALAANENSLNPGMGVYLSTDGGATWTGRVIADGNDGLPPSIGDVALAWDSFGNLFFAYVNNTNNNQDEVLISTDMGNTFTSLATFSVAAGDVLDQPSIATGPDGSGNQSVWIVAADVGAASPVIAWGASSTGLGAVSAFSQFTIAGSDPGNFGDITIGPNGEVATFWTANIGGAGGVPGGNFVSVDPDGLGPAPFSAPVTVTTVNTVLFNPGVLPSMPNRGAEVKGAVSYDRSTGPNSGRLYFTYIDSAATDDPATNVFLQYSDDNGATWSPRIQINDDTSGNSHLFPRVAVDPSSGNLVAAWYDARNDLGAGGAGDLDGIANNDLEMYAAISTDGGQNWAPNIQVSQNASSAILNGGNGGNDYGDYNGLVFNHGVAHLGWTDNSLDVAATNPDAPNFEVATARIDVPSGSGTTFDDAFENNETSDKAVNFRTIASGASQDFLNLTISDHKNNHLPDYDWFRWTAGSAGTFTATIDIGASTGDLELHLFTLQGITLVELKKTSGSSTLTLSENLKAGQVILVEVKGMNFAIGKFGQGQYTMNVQLQ